MKYMVLLLSCLLLLSSVSALNLEVQKIDKGSVVISELSNPAVFNFEINNKGAAEEVELYSLVGVSMTPKGTFNLPGGKSVLEVKVYPNDKIRKTSGYYTFDYEIKGAQSGIFKDTLQIKIATLAESVEVEAMNLMPGDSSAKVVVRNLQNTNLENVHLRIKSVFFDQEEYVSLKPHQEMNFSIPIDNNAIKHYVAGNYVVTTDVLYSGAKTRLESVIKYLEKSGISVNDTSHGIIIHQRTITKTNEGNVPASASIEMSKDVFSRLFTTYSLEPNSADRGALSVKYVWTRELQPAEVFTVNATTNYTLPFVIILLIVLVTIFVRIYLRTQVTLKKRVSFVKTSGGELALRVTIHVKSKKHVDNVQVIDRLPGMTKLYEKFGRKPDKIDSASGRVSWLLGNMTAGEERVISYIMYTNIKVVGRFELPSATGIFESDGKTHEVFSNRTFFISETMRTRSNNNF